jgi:hypothetical protein
LVGLAETGVDDALTERLTGADGVIATRIVDLRMIGALTCAFGLLKFMVRVDLGRFQDVVVEANRV